MESLETARTGERAPARGVSVGEGASDVPSPEKAAWEITPFEKKTACG